MADHEDAKKNDRKSSSDGMMGLLLGMTIGVALWAGTGDAIWLAIGIAIGAGAGTAYEKKRKDRS